MWLFFSFRNLLRTCNHTMMLILHGVSCRRHCCQMALFGPIRMIIAMKEFRMLGYATLVADGHRIVLSIYAWVRMYTFIERENTMSKTGLPDLVEQVWHLPYLCTRMKKKF